MSGLSRHPLGVQTAGVSKGTTASKMWGERAKFSHYGFLVIEWYCANGIPMPMIVQLKSRLIGPEAVSQPRLASGAREEHRLQRKKLKVNLQS